MTIFLVQLCFIGKPVPAVTWYKAGKPINKEDDKRISIEFNESKEFCIFVITNSTPDDAGDYTVIAENDYGQFKFTVTVLVGKPEGAELVTKTMESKSTVKVIEETLVDGKVVERTVKEETSTGDQPLVQETQTVDQTYETTSAEAGAMFILGESKEPEQGFLHLTPEEKKKRMESTEHSTTLKTTKDTQAKESIGHEETIILQAEQLEGTSTETFKLATLAGETTVEELKLDTSKKDQKDKVTTVSTLEDGEAPKFIEAPEPIFVDFGETIKLTCRVSGWKNAYSSVDSVRNAY